MTATVRSACYSGVRVYEVMAGDMPVMRRRLDSYINATQILRAAGLPKPARTKVLEREVVMGTHEKVQGGYAGFQGTWVPLESAVALAQTHGVVDILRPLFEYDVDSGEAEKNMVVKPRRSAALSLIAPPHEFEASSASASLLAAVEAATTTTSAAATVGDPDGGGSHAIESAFVIAGGRRIRISSSQLHAPPSHHHSSLPLAAHAGRPRRTTPARPQRFVPTPPTSGRSPRSRRKRLFSEDNVDDDDADDDDDEIDELEGDIVGDAPSYDSVAAAAAAAARDASTPRRSAAAAHHHHHHDGGGRRSRKNTVRTCEVCATTETPQWRRGPSGKRSLCNACGVKWSSGRLLTPSRPSSPATIAAAAAAGGAAAAATSSNPIADVNARTRGALDAHHLHHRRRLRRIANGISTHSSSPDHHVHRSDNTVSPSSSLTTNPDYDHDNDTSDSDAADNLAHADAEIAASYDNLNLKVGSSAWHMRLELSQLRSRLREMERNQRRLRRLLSETAHGDLNLDRGYRKVISVAKQSRIYHDVDSMFELFNEASADEAAFRRNYLIDQDVDVAVVAGSGDQLSVSATTASIPVNIAAAGSSAAGTPTIVVTGAHESINNENDNDAEMIVSESSDLHVNGVAADDTTTINHVTTTDPTLPVTITINNSNNQSDQNRIRETFMTVDMSLVRTRANLAAIALATKPDPRFGNETDHDRTHEKLAIGQFVRAVQRNRVRINGHLGDVRVSVS